jgi:hypothetical protein
MDDLIFYLFSKTTIVLAFAKELLTVIALIYVISYLHNKKD